MAAADSAEWQQIADSADSDKLQVVEFVRKMASVQKL